MPSARPSTADKRKTFRELHKGGCFVIPNPWNVGSALYLQGLGFKAIASTSSGHAHSEGYPDGAQSRDDVLAHYKEIAAATDIPLNADFENGFADDPDSVADNVTRCIATGVAGLSIEDSPQHSDFPLYDFDKALARVKAARAAIDKAGGDVVFTARTEGFIRGRADIDETIRRLKAFADAGEGCRRQGHQLPQPQPVRLHGERPRRHGRAADQRRRHAGARGDGCVHQISNGHRDRRKVRQLRRCHQQR
jgi:2-methylisocitrate lyase-like PEP mutase family enzyme